MIAQVYNLDFIRRRLAGHRAELVEPNPRTRQAAVAVILKQRSSDVDILFIKRAQTPGDPWSGHMAFPGGHRDPEDVDLLAAAIRETLEEIGVDLSGAVYLGPLDHQRAAPRARPLDMLIAPHVFELLHEPAFKTNNEVAEVVWTQLAPLMAGARHDTEARPVAGSLTTFQGYRLDRGHFVWGLTYRMLNSFFSILDPAWEAPADPWIT